MSKQLNVSLSLALQGYGVDDYFVEGVMQFYAQQSVDLLVSTLEIDDMLLNGYSIAAEVNEGHIRVPPAASIEIKYVSRNFNIIMPIPTVCKISFTKLQLQPENAIFHGKVYAYNFRALLLSPNLLECKMAKYEQVLRPFEFEIEQISYQILVFEGFYNALKIGECIAIWIPRNAPQGSLLAIYRAAQIVIQTYYDANVSLQIISSVSRHALLLHYFFGILAKYNYLGYVGVRNCILNCKYRQLDKTQFYDYYDATYHLYTTCLALSIIPFKYVKDKPQFSYENVKSAHNNMLREHFYRFYSDYYPDIFATQGIEPGDVFKFAFQDVLDFDASFRQFIVRHRNKYLMLYFLGKSDWRLQMNYLYLDAYENVYNDDAQRFKQRMLAFNLKTQEQFEKLQVFNCSSITRKKMHRVEQKTNQLPLDYLRGEVLTCMQCYLSEQKAEIRYNDELCDFIASPANMFLSYTVRRPLVSVKPEYFRQLHVSSSAVISNVLNFNYLTAAQQLVSLDEIALQLYQAIKNEIMRLFAEQTIETDLKTFVENAIKLKLLFTAYDEECEIFDLLGKLKTFLRGICLNIANSSTLREISTEFLLFLNDTLWIYQILTYLRNYLTENHTNSTQIMQLLRSFWPAVIRLNSVICDEILYEMLENEEATMRGFWLEKMCFGYISNYIVKLVIERQQSNGKAEEAERAARILISQLLYFTAGSQARTELLLGYLARFDFERYKLQLARSLLIYPGECPKALAEFLFSTQYIVSIHDFIVYTLAEAEDKCMSRLFKLKTSDSEHFLPQILEFFSQTTFLAWNLFFLEQVTLYRKTLFDVSDYSCYSCVHGNCGCSRHRMLKRLGRDYASEFPTHEEPESRGTRVYYGAYLLSEDSKEKRM